MVWESDYREYQGPKKQIKVVKVCGHDDIAKTT